MAERDLDARVASVAPAVRPHEMRRLTRLLYDRCGIRLRAGKEALVRSRLARRLAATGTPTLERYLDLVESGHGAAELMTMIDALTTNKTSFFREAGHFDFLRTVIAPVLARGSAPIRMWSAGCASGEEPYTMAMVLRESLPPERWAVTRILATDLSTAAIARARAARYDARAMAGIPDAYRRTAFTTRRGESSWRVRGDVRVAVRLARLNLMDEWPMRGPFDAIFCRNVMIYFDAAARERVVRRMGRLLAPGGHLFVGHAESLTAIAHDLRYVRPAVYVR